jgi:hypothetical protein
LRDAGIACQAAYEDHGRNDGLALADAALEVAGHRVAEPAEDLRRGGALLLGVDHIRLGKNRAAPRDPSRAGRRGHNRADLLDRVVHAQGLLVQERSGARSAEGIHREIADLEAIFLFFDEDQLGILPSHVNDRPDLWIEILNCPGLGDNLIDKFPPRSSERSFPPVPVKEME